MMKLNGEQGFTLIELMIVIAIIGILAAVAIPQLTGVREKANISSVKSEFKNIQTSLEMFFVDNNSYPAPDNGSLDFTNTDEITEELATGPDNTYYSYSQGAGTYEISWTVPNSGGSTVHVTPDDGVSQSW